MTTPINDLTRRLLVLAAPHGYTVIARLLGGTHGTSIELKATRIHGAETQEYARHLTLSALENRGAPAVAAEFAREARVALFGTPPLRQLPSRVRLRRARSSG